MSDDLQKVARDLVTGYKASGLSMSDIAALLVFALEAVARDRDTSQETMRLLSIAAAPFADR